jgi:hypothetical protein
MLLLLLIQHPRGWQISVQPVVVQPGQEQQAASRCENAAA